MEDSELSAGTGEQKKSDRSRSMSLHGLMVALIAAAAVITQMSSGTVDPGNSCVVQLNDGEWVEKDWHPHHCVMTHYHRHQLQQCLETRNHIVFIGTEQLKPSYLTLKEAGEGRPDLRVDMKSHSFLNEQLFDEYRKLSQQELSSLLVVHKPQQLHTDGLELTESCKESNLRQLLSVQQQLVDAGVKKSVHPPPLILLLPPVAAGDNPSKTEQKCLQQAQGLYSNTSSSIVYLSSPVLPSYDQSSEEGALPAELQFILNVFCNSPGYGVCCAPEESTYYTHVVAPTIVLILAVYLGVWLIFASGATFALTPHLEAMSCDLKKFFTIFNGVGFITLALFYLLFADRLEYFSNVNIVSAPNLLLLALGMILLCGALSWTSSEEAEFLSRAQAQEWRGWMVLTLIALRYTSMDQVLSLKLIGQMLVGAFIFLSSYGHFYYFWSQGGLSWRRVFKVLFQLNLLTVCVCLTLGTPYGGYYMVALLSGWFLFSCAFLSVWPALTPARLKDLSCPELMVAIKFVSAFLVVTVLPYAEGLFLPVFTIPSVKALLHAHNGSPYELYYFFYQQRYMALWGMLFGCIVVAVKASHPSAELTVNLKMAGAVLSVPVVLAYGLFVALCPDDRVCCSVNAFVSVLPVLCYVLLRNSASLLQRSHSSLLQQFGSLPLWLLVSHHHVLLAWNGQGLLVFFPNQYYLNVLSVATVYLFVYRVVGGSTKAVRDSLAGKTPPATTDS